MTWKIYPLGDRALVAEREEPEKAGDWAMMAAGADALRESRIRGIIDIIPAYTTVTVLYDPIVVALGRPKDCEPYALLVREIQRLLANVAAAEQTVARQMDIPVCYGGSMGPDLLEAAARSGLRAEAFIRAHAEAIYTVALVGFVPGFPYMTGMPEGLAQPRRSSPRSRVPAGSVGIGGGQTGIYPLAVPGGWQLIGRTPLRLFDAGREQPALLRAGDRVRFVPIDEARFRELAREGVEA
ncbi:Allophanate hydrolase subunit 1 [Paenibacillus curdlanolyticus YK9]|uniref:Allophanate hydrolase subunit 1 n=1 Tax=Paenibacillus curdlanolyticus YK9 TaxID=717606 RepID=E0I6I3_9BACL|nr:5-oxoprolinase subunit PxpB [Paenibacillus curdlanolyticus]EFM11649.1 Allophanate hydrolase subunit 1 [Paenibacillus curdlanolyticus YK9]